MCSAKNIYKTAEVAAIIGIHPNTVRLYEEIEFIPKPERQKNGYRKFTELHIEQIKLVRLALQIEIVQNGLRKKIVNMIKTSAKGDYEKALLITQEYLQQVRQERINAEEAIILVQQLLNGKSKDTLKALKRKEVSELLGISMDTLRNWEMNGLMTIKRKTNGYRVYSDGDIRRIKIIRALRCANYSLESILNMLKQLSRNPNLDLKKALNTPKDEEGIVAVCDRLISSLSIAENNSLKMISMLENMKTKFY